MHVIFLFSFHRSCVTSRGDPTTQCAIDSTHFMTDFIAEIEKRAAVMTSEDIGNGRTKFLECAKSFRQLNPNDVITYLRRGLEFEIKIVTEMDRKFKGTFKHIEKLMMLVQANDEACSSLSQLYREFNIDFHAATRNISYWNDMITQNPDFYQTFEEQRIAQRLHIQKSSDQVTAAKLEMVEKFKTVLTLTADVQQIKVFEYLNQWHFNRVQEENGNKSNFINLDVIQSWFENIARILWRTCEQLKAVMALKQHPSVDESLLQGLLDKSNELLVNHIKKSFIVEKQPPQVLKTNTR